MIDWLAEHSNKNLLDEKWLVAEDMRVAQQWKDRLNLCGHATINLHSKTLSTIVSSLIASELAKNEITYLGHASSKILIRSVLGERIAKDQLRYFQNTHSIDGLSELLAKSIRDLRLAEVTTDNIVASAFETPDKGNDVQLIYASYLDLLEKQEMVDYADCLLQAIQGIDDGTIELPQNLLVLIPELPRLSKLERRFLQMLEKHSTVVCPAELNPFEVASTQVKDRIRASEGRFEYVSGVGETNELRAVFQRVLSDADRKNTRLDEIEIVYSDGQQYVPLILDQVTTWLANLESEQHENVDLGDRDQLPVTFADGIPCVYSRPGRALRCWLRWVRHDHVQSRALQLLREGLLLRPESDQAIGYSRLANTLRKIPIGFQADRYIPKILDAIQQAQQRLNAYLANGDEVTGELAAEYSHRDFGLAALKTVLAIIEPIVELAPKPNGDAKTVLTQAKSFLQKHARAVSKLDRYAQRKLLDDIDRMLATIELEPNSDWNVLAWLENLPLESRVLASSPLPGRIHVSPLNLGGHAGRRRMFVVGLDDGRFPKREAIDPVLLDAERERLAESLTTALERSTEREQSLDRVLFRVLSRADADVCLSYSTRNLKDDRNHFPSVAMLELFRESEDRPESHMDDLLTHLGTPVGFVSSQPSDHLSATETQLASLLSEPDANRREQWLSEHVDYHDQQQLAIASKATSRMSDHDGVVPAAGPLLDLTTLERISPSRLEEFGACPRRYFFHHGLGIWPPDETVVDQDQWIDALQFGNLIHGVFEKFLVELTAKDQTPNRDRDIDRLLELLQADIESMKANVPIPNEDAYRQRCETLTKTCEIFLANEEEYCSKNHARPWVMEAAMGLGAKYRGDSAPTELDCEQPIELSLSDGRVIRVGGKIDRVDRLNSDGSERFAIWDYKSGSSFGFKKESPFGQGRKLQPFLYLGMLRHRIAAIGGKPERVASFGYFFPNPKTNGLRLQWTHAELKEGDGVLQTICDLIGSGLFPATTDPQDCKFCDFTSVCGDAKEVANTSLRKSRDLENTNLEAWRTLREIEVLP